MEDSLFVPDLGAVSVTAETSSRAATPETGGRARKRKAGGRGNSDDAANPLASEADNSQTEKHTLDRFA
jgi:hypothetical protein